MSPKHIFSYLIVLLLFIFAGAYLLTKVSQPAQTGLDDFAQCLTDRGLVMYGAAWCSHCQNQKRLFGASFSKITYVECPDSPELCTQKNISGYPTWITSDDQRLPGEQSLSRLAEVSGCSLP